MAYTGLIAPIPCGQGGLNADKNQAAIPLTDLIVAESLTFENGTWKKMGGATKLDSNGVSGAPTCRGLLDYWADRSTQRLISGWDDGTLLKETSSDLDAVTLKSGLSASARHFFMVKGGEEAAGNATHLFLFTGADVVQVLDDDGTTTGDINNPPADWSGANQPIGAVIHRDSLWGYGNLNDPHRIYKSLASDHEEYLSTVFTMSVFPGVGRRLVAGVSFGGFLFLFKWPRGIYKIDDSDTDSANWFTKQITNAVGVPESPYAALSIDNDILFMSNEGNFHLLSAVEHFKAVEDSDLSAKLKFTSFIRDTVNLGRLDQVQSVWYGHTKQAIFSLPSQGSLVNDLLITFDFMDKNNPKITTSMRDTAEALAIREDSDGIERPIHGDDAGMVYLMDQASRSKDGAGYNGKFKTPHTDFSQQEPRMATMRKNFAFLEVVSNPLGNFNLAIDVIIDGSLAYTLLFDMGVGGAVLGTFVLGTHALAGDLVNNVKKRMTGSGRRVSFEGSNSGDGQDYSISDLYVHLKTADERL